MYAEPTKNITIVMQIESIDVSEGINYLHGVNVNSFSDSTPPKLSFE